MIITIIINIILLPKNDIIVAGLESNGGGVGQKNYYTEKLLPSSEKYSLLCFIFTDTNKWTRKKYDPPSVLLLIVIIIVNNKQNMPNRNK